MSRYTEQLPKKKGTIGRKVKVNRLHKPKTHVPLSPGELQDALPAMRQLLRDGRHTDTGARIKGAGIRNDRVLNDIMRTALLEIARR